ncbi:MAG: arginase family protein [Candidatus Pacearchaeota archaeon]
MQIIKVPFSFNEKTRNCIFSPNQVLAELKKIESNEKSKIINYNSLYLEEIHVDINDVKESDYLIFKNSKEIFERNYKSFFIGGDKSINFPILRAFNKVEKNPFLIVFDSHCNFLDSLDLNESWIRRLIEINFVPSSIVLISSRNIYSEELEFLKNFKIQIVTMDILQEDLFGICDVVMERARNSSGFFITIDLSSVDPSFAPGVINIEPGGLSSRDLIYLIKRLVLLKNFRGASLVNIDSTKDINSMTLRLGAKILAEMI